MEVMLLYTSKEQEVTKQNIFYVNVHTSQYTSPIIESYYFLMDCMSSYCTASATSFTTSSSTASVTLIKDKTIQKHSYNIMHTKKAQFTDHNNILTL